jgi:hypothetical protein
MKKSWHLIFNGDCGDTRIDVIRWWEQRRLGVCPSIQP